MQTKNAPFYVLLALIGLTPLAFISSSILSLEYVKVFSIALFTLVSLLLVIYSWWKEKKITIPRHPLFITLIGLNLSILISSVVSQIVNKSPAHMSLFGHGTEIDTFSLFFLVTVAAFLVVVICKNLHRLFSVYLAILVPFILIALWQIIRLFSGADVLTLGVLGSVTTTIFGKWYELAIFSGFIMTMVVAALEFMTSKALIRYILMATGVLSFILLFFTNFNQVWIVIALTMLAIAALSFFKKHPHASTHTTHASSGSAGTGARKVPVYATVVFIVAIVFTIKGDFITSRIITNHHAEQAEVSLQWKTTYDITMRSLKASPFFGIGPNRFLNQYYLTKSPSINETPFWAADFNFGVGFIPTMIATTGVLGLVFWLLFFAVFIKEGIVTLRKNNEDNLTQFILTSSFLGTLFLWVMTVLYVPSYSILLLTFIMTGVFMQITHIIHPRQDIGLVWELGRPGKNRVQTVLLGVVTVGVLFWGFLYFRATMSRLLFQSGLRVASDAALQVSMTDRLKMTEKKLTSAIFWHDTDTIDRALTSVQLLKLQDLVATKSATTTAVTAEETALFTSIVKDALAASQRAIKFDPQNFSNYVNQAHIAEAMAPFKAENAYETARQSYGLAAVLNPQNPQIYYDAGVFEASVGHDDLALQNLTRAIQLKNNYIDAIVQVGILFYKAKAYDNAVVAFTRAIELNPSYPNIHYYDALALIQSKKINDGMAQLEQAVSADPNNQTINGTLNSLKTAIANYEAPVVPKQIVAPTSTKPTTTKASTQKKK